MQYIYRQADIGGLNLTERKITGGEMPRLDHIALEVSDMDRALEFYTDKMGFILVSREINDEEKEEFCFLKSDGTSLELISDLPNV